MTDNEIIKALECCADNTEGKCRECPFHKLKISCIDGLERNALDLINRQKEELDDLKRDDLPRCKDALRRANEIGMCLDKENQELRAEVERLVKGFEEVKKSIEEAKVLVVKDIVKAKAEAIKEFAERLKAMSEYGTINISLRQVENLVKEMTEGSDAE